MTHANIIEAIRNCEAVITKKRGKVNHNTRYIEAVYRRFAYINALHQSDTPISLSYIGYLVSKGIGRVRPLDHATVLHAIKKSKIDREINNQFYLEVESLVFNQMRDFVKQDEAEIERTFIDGIFL